VYLENIFRENGGGGKILNSLLYEAIKKSIYIPSHSILNEAVCILIYFNNKHVVDPLMFYLKLTNHNNITF